jgi:outer membrane protein assembly factor BamE (lipoprotein component of BamABCDE complex)
LGAFTFKDMNNGWIKLHRSLLDWEWYDDVNVTRLFLHCLFKANHADKSYRGTVVKRGTFLTGRDLLAVETGLSVRQVRTSLTKLKSTNELTIKTSRQGTVVEVVNYDKFQDTTSKATNERPTSDQQTTSNKNEKNEKNEKNKKASYSEDEGLILSDEFKNQMMKTYPRVNVTKEISSMSGWLLSNPKKRKKDYPRFINGWLKRHSDDSPSAGGAPILF